MRRRKKVIIPIIAVIVAVAVILPVGYFQFFEKHYTTVSASNVNADYIFSANFSKYTSTDPSYNPNFRYMDTTTTIDRGTANQSELSSNVTLGEVFFADDVCYNVAYLMKVTGNFSRNVLPSGMNIETEGLNISSKTEAQFSYNSYNTYNLFGGDNNNTSIKSYSTVHGFLIGRIVSYGCLLESYAGDFTNLVSYKFLNTTLNSSSSSERFQFQATLLVAFQIPASSIYIPPFNFIENTTLTGYSQPVYNTIGVKYVDNSTGASDNNE